MFGIERAQNVIPTRRRSSMSPSFRISAFKCLARSFARGAISSAFQGIQPRIGIGLLPNTCSTSRLWLALPAFASNISARSGRLRPASSSGAPTLLITQPMMRLFLLPPKFEQAISKRSFSCSDESVPGLVTKIISASSALAML